MTNSPMPYLVATGAAALMAIVAAWVIVTSPGEIDDVSAYQTPPATGAPIAITVEVGDGPNEIAAELEQLGIIDSDTQFRMLVSLMGLDGLLQAGDYEFAAGTPELDVIYRMRSGLVSTKTVTVIEGSRLEEVADSVTAQGIPREDFIAAANARDYDFEFVRQLPEGATLEGYLYPLTYTIRTSDTGRTVVEKMLEAFAANVPAGVTDQAAQQGLSLHDAVTLASIIQREAQVAEEKALMAQVFLTRLDLGMTLDADPTVQYAITNESANVQAFGYWKPGLTVDDLAYDTPYNTYLNAGLPPGPISNPGADTILAIVQPAATNYLYFVARPDGSHAFAETFEEHLANIEEFLGG